MLRRHMLRRHMLKLTCAGVTCSAAGPTQHHQPAERAEVGFLLGQVPVDQRPRAWMVERDKIPAMPGHSAPDVSAQPQAMRLDPVQGMQGRGSQGHHESRRDKLDLRPQMSATVVQLAS